MLTMEFLKVERVVFWIFSWSMISFLNHDLTIHVCLWEEEVAFEL